MWQVGLRKCIRPLLERFLRAMMECAALCSSLNRQSCEDCFTPQVSRAPGSTVEPSHFSPADLVEKKIKYPVVVAGLQMWESRMRFPSLASARRHLQASQAA